MNHCLVLHKYYATKIMPYLRPSRRHRHRYRLSLKNSRCAAFRTRIRGRCVVCVDDFFGVGIFISEIFVPQNRSVRLRILLCH